MLRVLLVLLPMVAFVLTQSWWFIALFLVLLVWMVGSAVRRPTDKMVGYAISIAQENGVPPPNLRSFRVSKQAWPLQASVLTMDG